MKLRKNNVKREHSVIKDIIPILEKITQITNVKGIIPGRIKPIKGSYPKPIIEFKVFTDHGLKCIAKSERAVQEVFIICEDPHKTLEYLLNLNLLS